MYEAVLDELVSEEELLESSNRLSIDRIAQIASEISNYLTEDADYVEYSAEARSETMTLYYYLRTGRAVFAVR